MPSTRRRLLTGTGAVVTVLSGCANFGPSAPHIAKLEVRLENRTVEDKTFGFAVETADGLREWVSQDVTADTSETIVREPSETFEPVAIHGVVDKQTARGDLLSSGETEIGRICLRITFRCSADEDPAVLQNTDISC
jgi:hypothetical protein